ncbi:hypothetical protein HA402_009923 [Bradysia odoriphaga]|nr:hypothetical protein HA402_009923 [Bradysia odoriphaga]
MKRRWQREWRNLLQGRAEFQNQSSDESCDESFRAIAMKMMVEMKMVVKMKMMVEMKLKLELTMMVQLKMMLELKMMRRSMIVMKNVPVPVMVI